MNTRAVIYDPVPSSQEPSIRFYNADLTLAPCRGHRNQTTQRRKTTKLGSVTETRGGTKSSNRDREQRCLCHFLPLSWDRPSLLTWPCSFSIVLGFCVCVQLCSWSNSVIIYTPPPLLSFTLCDHSCHHLVCPLTTWSSLSVNVASSRFPFFWIPVFSFLDINPLFRLRLKKKNPMQSHPIFYCSQLVILLCLPISVFLLVLSLWSSACLWLLFNHSSCCYVQFPLSGFASKHWSNEQIIQL